MLKKTLLGVLILLLLSAATVQAGDLISLRRQFREVIEKNPAAAKQYLQNSGSVEVRHRQ